MKLTPFPCPTLYYDALGRCVKRTSVVNGGTATTSYYLFDGEHWIMEYDGATGANTSTVLYGRGIDEVIKRGVKVNGVMQGWYYFPDRNGNTSVVTDRASTVRESYRYDAFGAPTVTVGAGQTAINNRFLFTGREWNAAYGFYEYRARAYNPTLGRFMSEDPKGFDAGDYNLYRYVSNDPLDKTDPFGLEDPVVIQMSLEVTRATIEASSQSFQISRFNSDGRGDFLERAKTAVRDNRTGALGVTKETSVGRGIPLAAPQYVVPPDAPAGTTAVGYGHNHTNGAGLSEGDKAHSNHTGKAEIVTNDNVVFDRYRPVASATGREGGKEGITDRVNRDGSVIPRVPYRPPEQLPEKVGVELPARSN